jgi:hypothetical protein
LRPYWASTIDDRNANDENSGIARIGINIDISAGQHLSMGESIVRVRALDELGRSGLEIAVNFLSGLTKENLGPDDTGQVWAAAQVALQRCLFARITDSQSKQSYDWTLL